MAQSSSNRRTKHHTGIRNKIEQQQINRRSPRKKSPQEIKLFSHLKTTHLYEKLQKSSINLKLLTNVLLFLIPLFLFVFIIEFFDLFEDDQILGFQYEETVIQNQDHLPPYGHNRWWYIVIHHSATTMGNLERIDRNHKELGYELGCAYHFIINNGKPNPDGQIEESVRWKYQLDGGHVEEHTHIYNTRGIGICIVGDLTREDITPRQYDSLITLTRELMDEYQISADRVIFHRDINQTSCPGERFPENTFYEDITHWEAPYVASEDRLLSTMEVNYSE